MQLRIPLGKGVVVVEISGGYVIAGVALVALALIFVVPMARDWAVRRRRLRHAARYARSLVRLSVADILARCEAEGLRDSMARHPSSVDRDRRYDQG